MALLAELRARGLRVTVDGDKVIVAPRSGLTDELRALIRANKPVILREVAAETRPALEMRGALAARRLLDDGKLRVTFDVVDAPLRSEKSGPPVSVVLAVRTPQGIVFGELHIPRERWDVVLFAQILEQTAERPQ